MNESGLSSYAEALRVHQDQLKRESWFGARDWWANFLFHFTDVKNAVEALDSGWLLSRKQALESGRLKQDSASGKVIDQTDERIADFVRFYFRPLTPTAFQIEGFRPKQRFYHKAHCPVPVYFAFDLPNIVSLKDARFSAGSLASHSFELLQGMKEFKRLPFEDIYSNSGWGGEDHSRIAEIKNRRHAEVVYPHRISLRYLRSIVCRSQAERDTLYSLLPLAARNRWKQQIVVSRHPYVFKKFWTFVREVTLSRRELHITFNIPSHPLDYGPFDLKVDIRDNSSAHAYWFKQRYENIVAATNSGKLVLDLSAVNAASYSVWVRLDEQLAYFGSFTGEEIPH